MKFDRKEIFELVKAGTLISLAFSILFYADIFTLFSKEFAIYFLISLFTVGIGFLFHELMHKSIAQKYGLSANFKASNQMLFLALVMSLFGFIIAAPGAVMIKGLNISKSKNGKISLAGPLANIILALIFLILLFAINVEGVLFLTLSLGLKINSLLAAFNLLPIQGIDGKKVYDWDKTVYFIVFILAVSLFIGSFII